MAARISSFPSAGQISLRTATQEAVDFLDETWEAVTQHAPDAFRFHMRIILDTSILFRPDLLRQMSEHELPVILPTVAYAERVRQLLKQGRDPRELDALLAANRIEVESMAPHQAIRFIQSLTGDNAWLRLARDAFVAGHLEDDDMLWTANPRDFRALGAPERQIALLPGVPG